MLRITLLSLAVLATPAAAQQLSPQMRELTVCVLDHGRKIFEQSPSLSLDELAAKSFLPCSEQEAAAREAMLRAGAGHEHVDQELIKIRLYLCGIVKDVKGQCATLYIRPKK
jgi:uncharacterized protein (DUF2252 family)